MVNPSPSEELPLPGPEEGTEVTAVDPADGERCCHHYPGIKGQCTADADVIVIYEGENVYNSPSEAPYCEEHVNLPDWIWERLEEQQQLVTDGGQSLGDRLRDAADGGVVRPANVWIEDPDQAMALINAIEWSTADDDGIRVLQELLMVVTGERDAIRLEVTDEQ